ncbi:efflux RND transporter permease subunit [Salinimonas sp. HHU 13199]|uniref:Efflux RND transporter permease subunit n=1 Tax=Salinimonas profundi TaxID=2729140 RepID=A0ABR8LHP1_9ALTE|nr:efflux RND transporter permease subunit [Salinimonas profundi]MBD3584713.1 efflux RND transporter permease subunit [Salinimonas profundi]
MSIINVAVKRPVAIAMFTAAVLLFGMVSLGRLSVNLLPELSYPTLTIRTDYTGAAPAEVEQLVSKPIEESIGIVKGVSKVTSVSRPGQSDVVLQFAWGTDMDLASLEVREKLDILMLPLDVEKSRLLRFNPTTDPVLRYGLSFTDQTNASTDGMKQLRFFAQEQLKRKLEAIDGVASVRVGGGLENEIQILVDQQKADRLNLSIDQIITRLGQENINAAGGKVDQGGQAFLVRTLNEFENLDAIRNLYIGRNAQRNIQLKDVAIVESAYKDRDAITRFNTTEGAELAIYKEGDANAVQVAQRVKQAVSQLSATIPSNYALDLFYDQSEFISQAISEVKSAAWLGGLLAMIVLYFFIRNIWTTLIISVSIPVSVIATFNLMYANDISLNIMSLGGIALAVGLLVDNSIVVLENIHRKRNASTSHQQAAIRGTKEVAGAIMASTLTTLAVFVPLIFVEGIAGQLFSDQAMTVSFALLASLIVSLTLIPSLAARKPVSPNQADFAHEENANSQPIPTKRHPVLRILLFPFSLLFNVFFRWIPAAFVTVILLLWHALSRLFSIALKPVLWLFQKAFEAIERGYKILLTSALNARVVVLGVAIIIAGAAVPLTKQLGVELIPSMAQGEFMVEVTLPAGAKVEQTDALLGELAAQASQFDSVARTYSLAGTGSLVSATASQSGDHWGKLNVVMQPGYTASDIIDVKTALRAFLSQRAGVQSQFSEPSLFTFDAPIQIEVQGYDLEQLYLYSQAIISRLQDNDRFADVSTTLAQGNPELKIRFDHNKLAAIDLSARQVSDIVAAQVGGKIATQFSVQDTKIDVLVRTLNRQRDDIDAVRNIIVNPQSDQPVPLGAVADVYMSRGPSEITRIGQQRVVVVSANLAYGDLAEGVNAAQTAIDDARLPLTLSADIAGQSEEMEQSFQSLQFALALAVFMVYLVMASQFESLLHPLLILFAVPLAGAGSVYGLWLTGTNISVVVFIGLIMLCGIAVNNAIVLVDRINQLRAQGMDRHTAIIEAATTRLRPIVMTTLTTILGLLPMAIGVGEGAEVRTPMAVTVIFGLLFCSVITLILLPVLYAVFDRKRFDNASETVAGEKTYG